VILCRELCDALKQEMADDFENGMTPADSGDAEARGIPRNVSEMAFDKKKEYNLSISGLTYKVSS
jgi:hypothetical protein